jgi:excisionase family DNA binding protein
MTTESQTTTSLMVVDEVASYLQVPTRWVYAHQHLLGAITLGDRKLRFRRETIEAYLETKTHRGRFKPM